ncbi:beta strand repeat-containing protein [Nocardioides sp. GCM10030258]|uniref:beta strand repeat-containing protein n=1 Tax=unclassified Nocardioides TaxID=2615069 RepID=UPI00360C8D32
MVTNNGTSVSYNPNGAFEALGVGQTGSDTFGYTVSDGHGGTDTAVVTVTVTGANDAPVIAAIEAGSLAYTENAAATPITATGTVVDVDSDDLATGTLTASFTAGGQAEDRLAVSGGTTIGTVVGGTNGSTPLVITLNATATPAAVQALLRDITYSNVSNNPSTTPRTVQFVLTDGDGGTSTPDTRGITVSAVDDAPTAVNDATIVGQDAPATAVAVLGNDTDVDAGPKVIASASDPVHGTVVLTGGTPGAHTGLTYEPDAGYCNNPPGGIPDTFTYTLNGGSTATVSVTVDCTPNASPVADDDAATIGENAGPTVVPVLGNDTDADGDTLAVSVIDQTATAGVVTNNGTSVSYNPNGAFEGLGVGQTASDTFGYTVSDGNGGTDTAVVTITVTGANDAPVIAAIEAGSLAYTENAAATPITATGTVADVDSDDLATGTLTASFTAGGQAEDRLAVSGGTTIGTVVGGTNGSTPLVITLNASATPAAVQALLRSVTYRNVSENPSTAARTVQFVLTDGDGGTSTPDTRGITVTPVDDLPVAVNDTATVGQNALATAVPVLTNDTDVDAGPKAIASASDPVHGTVVLTGGTSGAHTGLNYQPDAAYCNNPPGSLPDTFTYTLNGGSTATVSVTVDCTPNAAPVADDDAATIGENAGATVVPVLVGDTDANGDSLAVTGVDVTGTVGLVTNNGTDVSYDPNGAFESLGAGQTVTDTFSYTVSDGHGGTDTGLVTITVTGVNDAPAIANIEAGALAYTENAAATPVTATGTVADIDSANLATGTLTVSFSAGGLAEDRLEIAGGTTIGTAVGGTGTTPLVITLNATATPAAVQTLLRSVTYRNVSEAPSTAARTVRFVLTDGDGGTSNAPTRQVNVTAANDAPVIANIEAGALAYTENAAATPITATGTVVDADSADLATGTLTVSFTAGGAAEDRLAIAGGTTIGTVVGGTNGSTPLVITLNATATPAAVQTLVRSITYANVSNNPSTAARTVRFVLTDGDGGTSAPVTRGITVTAVDDAPVAVDDGTTVPQGATPTAIPVLTNDTDVDAGPKTIASASDPANGTVALTGGTTGAHTGLTYAPDPGYCNNPPGTTLDTFTYTLNGGSTATVSVTVTCAVNGAPVIAAIEASPLAVSEGDPFAPITATGTVTDTDSANFATGTLTVDFSVGIQPADQLGIRNEGVAAGQIGVSGSNVTYGGTNIGVYAGGLIEPLVVNLNVSATPAAVQALLRNVTYRSLSDTPAASRTVRFVLTDGDGGTSNAATRAITVTPVNDAPVLLMGDFGSLAYDAGDPATVITPNSSVNDPDSANFDTGSLFVDFPSGGHADDRLEIQNQGTAAGQIGVSGTNVTYGGTTIGTFSGGTGLTPLVTTFNANATQPAAQALLRAITYRNVAANPVTTDRFARFVLADGDGGVSGPIMRTITVTAPAQPPVVTTSAGTTAYTENGAALVVDATVTVTDSDNANLAGATVQITGGFVSAEDVLSLTPPAGITQSYDAATGTLTLSGSALVATYQTALRGVRYNNSSNNPATANRTLTFIANDGSAPSNSATKTLSVAAVNDPPAASLEGAVLAYTENAAATPITVAGTVTDVDSADFAGGTYTADFSVGGQAEDRLAIRNQGVAAGQIGVSGANVTFGGVTIGTFVGGNPGTTPLVVTLNASATPAAVQALHRNVTYQNVSENPVTASRTVRVVVSDGDGGTSGAGIRTITVARVNDAPAVSVFEAAALAYTENAAATPITATMTVTDVDSADLATGTLTVDFSAGGLAEDRLAIRNQGTAAGEVGVSGANVTFGGVTIGTFVGGNPGTTPLVVTFNASATAATVQAVVRNVTYANVSEAPSTAARTVRAVVTDGDGGTSAARTRTITVAAVDDAPVVAASAGTTPYTEQAPAVVVDAGLSATDLDAGNVTGATVSIVSPLAGDTLHFTTQGTITGVFASNVLTLSGSATLAQYQAALRTVQFSNATNDAPGATRLIGFRITTPVASNTSNKTIAITQVNDAPVVDLNAATPLAYAEQAPNLAVAPAATIVDPDSPTLSSLVVTITVGRSALDTLRLDPLTTGFTANYVAATGALTITRAGGTLAQFQAALRTVQFANTSNDPDSRNDGTPNPTDADRTLSAVVNDGVALSAPVTRGVTITPVNDAPGAPTTLPVTTGIRNTAISEGAIPDWAPHIDRAIDFVGGSVDPDGLESNIFAANASAATAQGGSILLSGGGMTSYNPPASGTLASDTFGYSLTDGTTASAPFTFTINFSGAVWYVSPGQSGNGTSGSPFGTIAAGLAAAGTGQPVFVFETNGGSIANGPVVLAAGDKLLGEGIALTWTEVGSAAPDQILAAGDRPVLTASGADVVTLASNTTVAGLSINPDGASNGVFGNATSGVNLRSMDVTDTGTAATQPGIEMTGSGNGLTFTAPVSLSTTQAGALNLTGAAVTGTVDSITVSNASTSPGIRLDNTTGTRTFTNVAITTTGQPGVVLNSAGTVNFPAAGAVTVATTGGKALDATSTNLATSVFDSITVTGSSSGGVRLSSTTGAPRLGDGVGTDLSLQTTSGAAAALDIASTDNVMVDAAGTDAISATGGPALDIRNSNGSSYTFDTVNSTNSANDGINLDTNLVSPVDANAGAISGAAGIAVDVNGGAAVVNFAGAVNDGFGQSVEVTGRTGGVVTLSGSIADGTDAGGGIVVNANFGGSTTFSGTSKILNTGTAGAVLLSNNGAPGAGHLVTFSNGGLDIDTVTGQGLAASTGQVAVTGTGNSITTFTGIALSISGTTIGSADVTFQSISANGAPSGIVLNDTGSLGGVNVTGTGAAPTGGVILNTTGAGISLTNADDVSFNNMRIAGTNRSGVQGVGVTGFSFTNGIILQAGDSAVNDNDSSIAFNTTTGGQNNNVDGAVTITGNSLQAAYGGGVDIFNYAGTITNANISNNQISSSFDNALSRRSGIALNLFGSTTTVASLVMGTIDNNTVTGFPSGDGITVQGANTASATAPQGTYGTPGGARVTISGNIVIGDTTNRMNGFGISASVTGRGQGNFAITNNGSAGSPMQNMKGSAIGIGAAGDVTVTFTVTGNRIAANNLFGSSGIALGTDKNIQADLSTLANPVVRATITGNMVSNTSGSGVGVLHRDSNGSLDLRLENNVVQLVQQSGPGIRVDHGSSGNAAYNPTMCASIANNNSATGPVDGFGDTTPGITLSKRSALAATYKFGLVGLVPSPATNAQVETHLTTLNPFSALGAGFFAGKKVAVRTGSNFTSCSLPAGV